MKKWRFFPLFLILAVLLTAGCGKEDSAQIDREPENKFNTEDEVLEDGTEPPVEQLEVSEPEAPEPEKREIVDGKIRSYFTGEWIDANIGTQRPLAIMLSMTPAALPMSGPSNASVIYECPVENVLPDGWGFLRIGKILRKSVPCAAASVLSAVCSGI